MRRERDDLTPDRATLRDVERQRDKMMQSKEFQDLNRREMALHMLLQNGAISHDLASAAHQELAAQYAQLVMEQAPALWQTGRADGSADQWIQYANKADESESVGAQDRRRAEALAIVDANLARFDYEQGHIDHEQYIEKARAVDPAIVREAVAAELGDWRPDPDKEPLDLDGELYQSFVAAQEAETEREHPNSVISENQTVNQPGPKEF